MNNTPWRHCAQTLLLTLALSSGAARAAPAGEPIVIAQSLALGDDADGAAWRIADATQSQVDHLNAAGGLNGRPVKLLTLDDTGDPKLHAANLRNAVRNERAVALVNCVGDAVCSADAALAEALRVPLVGPITGIRRVARQSGDYTFAVRPGYDKEAAALARQLGAMGIFKVALLTDDAAPDSERLAALARPLADAGIRATVVRVDRLQPESFERALQQMAQSREQAVLMALSPGSIDALAAQGLATRREWPAVIASFANGSLVTLVRVFRDRVIGFTSVVPDPESLKVPLSQQLREQVQRHGNNVGISYEGLEAFINLKVCLEAIRRAGSTADPERIAAALRAMERYDLGGYTVSFGRGRSTGSDYLEVGMRTRRGHFIQ